MSPRFDGPDVSHYQGDTFPWQWCVDMHQIRFGACKMTDGAAYIDSTGEHNRNAMKAVGLRWRGMYHYARAGDPVANVKHFATEVGPLEEGEFVFLDVESGMTPTVGAVIAMLEAFEVAYPGRVAAYQGMFFASGNSLIYDRWPWILPAYPWPVQVMPVTKRPVMVWQWAGGAHGIAVPGTRDLGGGPVPIGNVDSNIVLDEATLDRLCAHTTPIPPVPPPPAAPEEEAMNPNRFVESTDGSFWEIGVDSKGQWSQTTRERGVDWDLYNPPNLGPPINAAFLERNHRPPVDGSAAAPSMVPHDHDLPPKTGGVSA